MESSTFFSLRVIQTQIPARLDRLPFSAWHWFVCIALGITWILDGLQTTLGGVVSGVLKETMNFTDFELGLLTSIYLIGGVLGSIFFGYLCDKFGRKKFYLITPIVYLSGTALTAFTWEFKLFAICRFVTGAGIGGEYAAMNSAIDELIPARVRGTVDLIINGSFWAGTAIASACSIVLLNPQVLSGTYGWRALYLCGGLLGIIIVVLRLFLPESPRWLLTHGKEEEAERIVSEIEQKVCKSKKISISELSVPDRTITVYHRTHSGATFVEIFQTMVKVYPKRSILGLALMISQAFFYNGVTFSFTLIMLDFYHIKSNEVGLYTLPYAVASLLGPLLLGRLFDILGRRVMISSTYFLSGLTTMITAILFVAGLRSAITETAFFSLTFLVASPAASSAYLTVSEIFPLEIRALAIAVFYSIGTCIGGLAAPSLFGYLLETENRWNIFYGYLFCALLLVIAGVIEIVFGVNAEQKSLEEIAPPLASQVKAEDPLVLAEASSHSIDTTETVESRE